VIIHTFFLWLTGTLTFGGLAWLLGRFSEGLFRFKFGTTDRYNEYDMIPLWGVAIIGTIVGGVLSGIYLGVNEYTQHVPLSSIYSVGLEVPLLVTASLLFASGCAYFGGKVVGGLLHSIGDGIRSGVDAIKEWSRSRKAKKLARTQKQAPQPQLTDWQLFEQKSTDVANLCSSLRSCVTNEVALQQLSTIAETLQKVKQVVLEDGNKQSVVPMLVSDYLDPSAQYLRVYERLLKRNLDSAKSVLEEMEQKTLPLMAAKIGVLYDQIHVNDVAQLSTASSAFEVARTLEVKAEAPAELRL